ncbi:STAS domain-containing protein [Streptomyces sp. NPDC048484]|uniref:STAS domain-containing protein n=1 Tax=Streptomyces sp. NPDC048484 TaxID=3155146 RepID=UPI003417D803
MSEDRISSAFRHTQRDAGGTIVIELRGEIDILTASPLSVRLDDITERPCPDVVLDLRPVSFIDCSGLRLLCRAQNRVTARRGRLRLIVDDTHFLRILQGAHLAGVFEMHSDLPEALRSSSNESDLTAAGTVG